MHGLVTQDRLAQAWSSLAPGQDLGGLLLQWGLIDAPTLQNARLALAQSEPASGSSAASEALTPVAASQSSTSSLVKPAKMSLEEEAALASIEMSGSIEGANAAATLFSEGVELEAELGRGGMGSVWRAQRDGQAVVVKLINADLVDPGSLKRFSREAQTLASLSHRNIVRIIDYRAESNPPFMILEFIEGENLKARIERRIREGLGPMSFSEAAVFFEQLADALICCHMQGVVHRDLKPENIMIESGTERPVILDFGLVSVEERESQRLTQTGQLIGTPRYMPIEQLSPDDDEPLGSAADVWSLGATLYYALTGFGPHHEADSLVTIIKARLAGPPALPSTLAKDIPKRVDELLMALLATDPEQRPSAAELRENLAAELKPKSAAPSNRTRAPKGPASPLPWSWILAAAGLIIAALIVTPLLSNPPLLTQIQIDGKKLASLELRTARAELEIKVDRPGSLIHALRVNSEDYVFSAETRELSFKLEPGNQTLSFAAVDLFGRVGPARSISVTLDQTPPDLKIDAVDLKALPLCITGEVSEDCRVVLINEVPANLIGRRFRIELDRIGSGPVLVKAEDRSGLSRSVEASFDVFNGVGSAQDLQARLRAGYPLIVGPGRFEMQGQLLGSGELCFSTESVLDCGSGLKLEGDWRFRGGRVESSGSSGESLINAARGRFEFEDLRFQARGRAALVLGDGERGESSPTAFLLKSCSFQGAERPVLLARNSVGQLESCELLRADAAKTSRSDPTVVFQRGSQVELRSVQVSGGVNVTGSSLRFEELSITEGRIGLVVLGGVLRGRGLNLLSQTELALNIRNFSRADIENLRLKTAFQWSAGALHLEIESRGRFRDVELDGGSEDTLVARGRSMLAISRLNWKAAAAGKIRAEDAYLALEASSLRPSIEVSRGWLKLEDCDLKGGKIDLVGCKLEVLRCQRDEALVLNSEVVTTLTEDWSAPRDPKLRRREPVVLDSAGGGEVKTFQTALELVKEQGFSAEISELSVRPGRYEGRVEIRDDLIIRSLGERVGDVIVEVSEERVFEVSDGHVEIFGLVMIRDSKTEGVSAVKVVGLSELELTKCQLKNTSGTTVSVEGVFSDSKGHSAPIARPRVVVRDCEVESSGTGAIRLRDGLAHISNSVLIDRSPTAPGKRGSLALEHGSYARISELRFQGARERAIELQKSGIELHGGSLDRDCKGSLKAKKKSWIWMRGVDNQGAAETHDLSDDSSIYEAAAGS